jgi:uncharacterized membrane protein YgcG
MRLMLNVLVAAALLAVPARASAQTSMNDLLGLKAAGFTDDLLIATFQSDGTIYYLTAADLIYLREQGLGERVLLAMLATRAAARDATAPPFATDDAAGLAFEPQVVATLQDRQEPVVVTVEQTVMQTVEQRSEPRAHRPSQIVVPVAVPVAVRQTPAPKPVYWGFGGQRRPDTWAPPASSSGSDRGSASDRGGSTGGGTKGEGGTRTVGGTKGKGGATGPGGSRR